MKLGKVKLFTYSEIYENRFVSMELLKTFLHLQYGIGRMTFVLCEIDEVYKHMNCPDDVRGVLATRNRQIDDKA